MNRGTLWMIATSGALMSASVFPAGTYMVKLRNVTRWSVFCAAVGTLLIGCTSRENVEACCRCLVTHSHNTFGTPIQCLDAMSVAACTDTLAKGGQIYFQAPCLNICSDCAGVLQAK